MALENAEVSGNVIAGNYIGTDSTGLLDRGNTLDGVYIFNGAHNNTVGGSSVTQRNIIAGNNDDGIQIDGEASDGNIIQNNWIGLASDGTTVLGNSGDGIFITGGADNTMIGGINLGNVVMGNGLVGIEVDGASIGTIIQGNYVGTNVAGTVILGSQQNGVLLENGVSNTTIGGSLTGEGNVITDSGRGGVYTAAIDVNATASTGNRIVANSIYGNQGIGIDLGVDGVTTNDTLDPDAGGNNLQNFPVITSATTSGTGTVKVSGTLNTLANLTGVVIQLYATPSAGNPTGRQGKRYLGSTTVSTDASGNATFINITLSATVAAGEIITATATYANNTSEFSQGVALTMPNTAPTFNAGNGNVTTTIGHGDDWARAMAVQNDGKIVVAGYASNGSNDDFAVARYNVDGTLDTSFGTGGKTTIGVGSSVDQAYDIKIQADGKIVIAGNSYTGSNGDFALVRLNGDGSLDSSFGVMGEVVIDFAGGTDEAQSIVVQPDGKIIVGGSTNASLFAIARLNSDGSLDTSFGTAGSVTTDVTAGLDSGYSLTLQSDGKILFVGAGNNNFAVVRYNSNGVLDGSFGTGGKVETDLAGGTDFGRSVLVNSDGTILVSGYSSFGDFLLVKYTSTGVLDNTFGSNTGKVLTDISGSDLALDMVLQADGKIILGGYNGSFNSTLVRYNVNGSLDTSFGSAGKVTTTIASGAFIEGLAVRPDGRIVAGVTATVGGSRDFGVISYLPDGSIDTTFNTTSVTNTLDGNPSYTENGSAVVLDSNVQIFDAELSLSNFNGATLTLARNGDANTQDVFSATGTLSALTQGGNLVVGGVTVGTVTTNSNGTLLLTFNTNATQAWVNSVLQQIAYSNNSDVPPASVQIDWAFSDGNTGSQGTGGALTATGSTTVNITSVNDAPVVTTSVTTINYTENDPSIVIDSAISVSDIDNTTLTGATIQIHPLTYRSGEDVLSFSDQLGITGNWNSGTGVLTLSGTTSVVNYQTALRSVGYYNTSEQPDNNVRTVVFVVNDGAGFSAASTRDINVFRVNDAPVNSVSGDGAIVPEDSVVQLLNSVHISDVDAGSGVYTVTLSVSSVAGTLSAITGSGVTISGSGTNTLVLSGTLLSINNYFTSTGTAPIFTAVADYNGPVTFTVLTNDNGNSGNGGALTDSDSINGSISAFADIVNDSVTVNEDTPVTFTPLSNDTFENSGRTISNINGTSITSGGSIAITGGNVTLNADGTLTFTPENNYTGTPSFTYTVTSGGVTETATVNLTVIAVNDAPSTTPVTLTASNEDTSRLITPAQLLANAGDVDGNSLTATGLTLASGSGTLTDNGDGTWTYSPGQNDDSAASFSYTIADGHGGSVAGSATLDLSPVNDAPTSSPVVLTASNEDTPRLITQAQLLANAGDVDGNSLTATGLTLATGSGTLTDNGDGTWTYSPGQNDDSAASFSYTIADGNGGSVAGSATLDLTPVNDAPTSSPVVLTASNEDTPRLITQAQLLANAGDVDGNSLTATGLTLATGSGTLTDNGDGTWTYSPGQNDDSAASFSYTIADGNGGSVAGSATLDLSPVNDAPTSSPVVLTASNEDTPRLITQAQLLANAGDVDVDSLTATGLTLASGSGTLTDNGDGTWTYTPGLNDDSAASFSYTIADGHGGSVAGSATLDLTPVNDAPTSSPVVLTASNEDTPRLITQAQLLANAGDVDGNSLTATGLTLATGSLVNNGDGTWTYTPGLNDDSAASFSYTIADGQGGSAAGSATLDLTPVNDAPTSSPVVLTASNEDTPRLITQAQLLANAGDVDGDSLSATGLSLVSGSGTLTDNGDGTWTYSPGLNDDSAASFSYTIADGQGGSVAGSATLDLTPVNDAPTTTPVTLTASQEDTPRLITQAQLLANAGDVDVDSLTATGLTLASGSGTLTDNGDGTWTYTPGLNDDSAASFSYTIADGHGGSVAGSATLDLSPVNDAPTSSPVVLTASNEDTPRLITQAQLLANAGDVDVDSLTATGLTLASGSGTLTDNGDGTWTYSPGQNDDSAASFSYTIADGQGGSVAGSATLDLTPVNDAPTSSPVVLTASNEDTPRLITQAQLLANAGDVDGNSLTATGLTLASGSGSLVNNGDGTWTYTPGLNDDSAASFSYTIADGHGGSVAGSATLDLLPVNDAPTSSPVVLTASNEDTPRLITQAQLLANAGDVDGDSLSATGLSLVSGSGTLTDNGDGTWTYTPGLNDDSAASFSYTIADGNGGSVAGSATLDLSPVNDAPSTTPVTLTASQEDTPRLITPAQLLANAGDVDGNSLTATGLTLASGSGSLVNNGDGTWTYTPGLNDDSAASFSYTIADGNGGSVAGSATLDLTPVNDSFVITGIKSGVVTKISSSKFIGSLVVSGVDNHAPKVSFIDVAPTIGSSGYGVFTMANGIWTYELIDNNATVKSLKLGQTLSDSFAFQTSNGITQVVIVIINGINSDAVNNFDPPFIINEPIKNNNQDKNDQKDAYVPFYTIDTMATNNSTKGNWVTNNTIHALTQNNSPVYEIHKFTSRVNPSYGYSFDDTSNSDSHHEPNQAILDAASKQASLGKKIEKQVSADENDIEFWDQINRIKQQFNDDSLNEPHNSVEVQIMFATSLSFSAGFVSWLLRGGSLLASIMSTIPLLNKFDPVPILRSSKKSLGILDKKPSLKDDDFTVDSEQKSSVQNSEAEENETS